MVTDCDRAAAVNGIALDGDLRAKVADAADTAPARYPDNPVATRMLLALGTGPQPRRGAVALVAEEDAETGLTGSLSAAQLVLIVEAHQTALHQHAGRCSAPDPATAGSRSPHEGGLVAHPSTTTGSDD